MKITILLADDHPVVRDGLRFLLEDQSDLKVIGEAATGREAVDQATRLCPQVVIMDITMPGLNGIEATRKICQRCPATQVIILSMHASSKHIFRAVQAGANGYLLKGSASHEVVTAVRAVLAGQRYLSQKISRRVLDDFARETDPTTAEDPLARLSGREREVLQLVVEGKSSVEIADLLHLSPKTVETYRSRLMRKLNLEDLPSLVKLAIQHGLTPLE